MLRNPSLNEATIVVPTCDRPEQVRSCLDALVSPAALEPVRVAEIVVVDNGARAIDLRDRPESAPSVRIVRQPIRGASHARNRGLEVARSEIVAFVDDDVIVEDGWLRALIEGFSDPGVAAVVGPIRLAFGKAQPEWLTPNLATWFSALDLGTADRLLDDHERGWGANLAVRRELALAAGGFDPRLGPGTTNGFGDDVEFQDRLCRGGGKIAYAAEAAVRHVVLANRLHRRWLLRRAYSEGRARVMLQRARNEVQPRRRPLKAGASLLDVLVRGFPNAMRAVRDPKNRRSVLLATAAIKASYLGSAVEQAAPSKEAAIRFDERRPAPSR